MKLHLIRHGITNANEKKLYCGQSDIPLSLEGIRQIKELKKYISYPKGELYISSGLQRTVQTAGIIYNPDYLYNMAELQEINFGDFEMKSHEDLKDNPYYNSWINNVEQNRPPGGETKQEFLKRVLFGLDKIKELAKNNNVNNVVAVVHGGTIAVIMEEMFPNYKSFYGWRPDNGRGYSLSFDSSGKAKFVPV